MDIFPILPRLHKGVTKGNFHKLKMHSGVNRTSEPTQRAECRLPRVHLGGVQITQGAFPTSSTSSAVSVGVVPASASSVVAHLTPATLLVASVTVAHPSSSAVAAHVPRSSHFLVTVRLLFAKRASPAKVSRT